MKLKGVNLGGWLVLERWITPSLFHGLEARDETSFCLELGDQKTDVFKRHWDSFITEEDFKWFAHRGLNSLRIPVPYWTFGDVEPYQGSIHKLDWALQAGDKHGLGVILDLHTAPGSQNGYDHSGSVGHAGWHKNQLNVRRTVNVIGRLAERYQKQSNLIGIGLLNEPDAKISKKTLLNFYDEAYKRARQFLKDDVAIIISDCFNPKKWTAEMLPPNYKNVWLDIHLYQSFNWKDRRLSLDGHLKKTKGKWKRLIADIQSQRPALIGEWSLGLTPETFRGMDEEQISSALQRYANAQLNILQNAEGWFFWTYKTEDRGGWNYKHCVEKGLLP